MRRISKFFLHGSFSTWKEVNQLNQVNTISYSNVGNQVAGYV